MSSDEYDGERRRRHRRRRSSRSSSRRHRDERHREEYDDADARREGASRSDGRPEISLRSLIVGIVTVVAVVVIGGGGWYYYRSVTSPQAIALRDARKQPLLDMVIADQPDAERQLRAAIDRDLSQPNSGGPSRESALVSELRSAYIAPTLRRADDASLIATMAARAAFIDHLNKTDTKVCREFALGGVQHPEALDPEGKRLYDGVLKAVEDAYRSGRAAKQTPAVPNLQQITAMLNEAGFIKSDYDKLNSFATLSNDITCYITLKVNQVPDRLRPEERGPYSRFILGN